MPDLQRLTTEYIEVEDRIRLAGAGTEGSSVTLWLTRRLLDRLIPHLTLWLEQQHADLPRPDVILEFAQQKARSQLVPQPPVTATSAGQLVLSVDITPGKEQLHLNFKAESGQTSSIAFAPLALRQWLAILHQQYQTAEWLLSAWPAWMTDRTTSPDRQAAKVVWH